MLKYLAVILFGNKSNRICEPSRGGIGSKLNANKKTFRNTPYHNKFPITESCKPNKFIEIINNINSNIAKIKFDSGPANETIASSFKGLLKLFLFTGTGFAQPISAHPDAKAAIGIIILPTMSRCLIGFRVNLPDFLAVSSPYRFAKYACENS